VLASFAGSVHQSQPEADGGMSDEWFIKFEYNRFRKMRFRIDIVNGAAPLILLAFRVEPVIINRQEFVEFKLISLSYDVYADLKFVVRHC
jgi:hypothetical protein